MAEGQIIALVYFGSMFIIWVATGVYLKLNPDMDEMEREGWIGNCIAASLIAPIFTFMGLLILMVFIIVKIVDFFASLIVWLIKKLDK